MIDSCTDRVGRGVPAGAASGDEPSAWVEAVATRSPQGGRFGGS
jgi:hypothetical protein